MKSIAIFGATGRTGKLFTELALKEGYQVKALLRAPAKLDVKNPNLQIIQGDVTDLGKVQETINGTEAVLLLIGMSPSAKVPADFRAKMSGNILAAMEKSGVKRIIRQSNFTGASHENDRLGIGLKIVSVLLGRKAVQDETAATDLIMQSDLDWTIVRNSMITSATPTGDYAAGYLGEGKNSCTAGDLAAFILQELKDGKYIRQMPFVHN